MTTQSPSEIAQSAAEFLTSLFGMDVTGEDKGDEACTAPGAVATYVDSEGAVRGQIACDLPAAAMLGAMLTQIPMGAVEDCVAAGSLTDSLTENLGEVMNIAVNLVPSDERLVLRDVQYADSQAELATTAAVKLSVGRYGDGMIYIACS